MAEHEPVSKHQLKLTAPTPTSLVILSLTTWCRVKRFVAHFGIDAGTSAISL